MRASTAGAIADPLSSLPTAGGALTGIAARNIWSAACRVGRANRFFGINAPPMTFEVGGRQYLAIQSGLNRNAQNINSMTPELREMRNHTMLFVFGL
jgi:hypothetical protein